MSDGQISVRVARVETVAERIKRVRLVSKDGGPLPMFSAGSHIVVTMREPNRTIKNAYSLMGPIGDTEGYEISVLRTTAIRMAAPSSCTSICTKGPSFRSATRAICFRLICVPASTC